MNSTPTLESPFRRALVPLDGSRIAESILPSFLRMARPLQIDVMLVRVIVPLVHASDVEENPEIIESVEHAREQKRKEADDYLQALASMPCFDGLQVQISVRTGQAPEQIIAAARESDVDLIAMTTHGRTGLRRLLFGSVAEAVLRTSHIPVFVLRAVQVESARRVA